jgi:methionyl-tRNA formyltransferase
MRVVFFGNSEGAFSNRHFEALLTLPCEIVGVVDVPPARRTSTNTAVASTNFIATANARGIQVFEPGSPNTSDFVAAMQRLEPDVFLAVGYTNLLKAELLGIPRLLAANFHASLLPAYRGKHPLYWALQNGEKWVGLTVHVMDHELDTGDILYQVREAVLPGDSVADLYEKIMILSVPLVGRLLADAEAGTLTRRPQGTAGASYYGAIR